MPQLSLYVDDQTAGVLRASSEREGLSLSKYVGRLIRQQAGSGWPVGFWDTYGALADDSFVKPQELDFADDAPRLSF